LPDLVGALDHASRAMRDAAATALAEATGERFGTDATAWRSWLAAQAKP
nr:hypothetical protein [Planctomycetota bacterium]